MENKRPNILFMHVDQLHFRALSVYGNPHVKTPGMDRLAAEGHSLTRMYTAMPQCCPARASWYTGRMATEHGVPVNGCPIDPSLPDLGQWLRRHGDYDSVYAGKWHIPARDVAKSFRVIYGSGKGEFADAAIARAAIGYLRNHKTDDKPFFLNVGFMNPHDCCYASGAAGGSGKFRLAREIEKQLPPLPENFEENTKFGARTRGWGELEWRYYIYCYYRYVEMVDAEIARLYGALADSPHADNTLVVFTADHGDGLGFHGNVSKGYMEEEAWRVPAIVVFPGRIAGGAGRDSERLTSGVDLPATICDYAGAPMLPKMTVGRSLRPLLEGKPLDKPWRRYVVGETPGMSYQAAVRDVQHKTIFYKDSPEAKVYDLLADPLEMKNLATTEAGESVRKRHMDYFREYLDSIELCEGAPWGPTTAAQNAIYTNYNAWYRRVREGAAS